MVYPQVSILIRCPLQPFPLLSNTWLRNHNPEVRVISSIDILGHLPDSLWRSVLVIWGHSQLWSVYQKHKCGNVLHWRHRWVVPSHCLHSAILWVWVLWMQRWLDHHPGWVWLLVPCQMHWPGLSLVSLCWCTSVLCPQIPMIWVCQMQLDM